MKHSGLPGDLKSTYSVLRQPRLLLRIIKVALYQSIRTEKLVIQKKLFHGSMDEDKFDLLGKIE
jgi:hypothetical protein